MSEDSDNVESDNVVDSEEEEQKPANDILMGYYCEVDGDDTIHRDEDELKSAEWTLREDIVLQPDESSLTNEMMKMFKEGIVK